MKAASEFSAGSRPPRVSSLSQSERRTDGDDRPGKPQREEHQGRDRYPNRQHGSSRWEPRLGIKDSTLSWLPASEALKEKTPALAWLSKWARLDSNQGPTDYESAALTS